MHLTMKYVEKSECFHCIVLRLLRKMVHAIFFLLDFFLQLAFVLAYTMNSMIDFKL